MKLQFMMKKHFMKDSLKMIVTYCRVIKISIVSITQLKQHECSIYALLTYQKIQ